MGPGFRQDDIELMAPARFPYNIPGRNSLRHFRVSAPEIMNSPSPR
jgi:hypothetical protein